MRRGSLLLGAAGLAATLVGSSGAMAAMPCASEEEAHGFHLRHLQTRLMVAALSCNQKEAYNSFMAQFMTEMTKGGKALQTYFQRTGLGTPALNKHVTDLANGAALYRSADPNGYCAAAWSVFWDLQQKPDELGNLARQSVVTSVEAPIACSAVAPAPAKPAVKKTAAPQEAKAAVKP
jgi:hypothetical protein